MNQNNYKYITNQIFPHGGGTRVGLLVNAIIFSKLEKKEFVLTPFSYETEKKEFDSNPITKTFDYISYCKQWDKILNLNVKKIYEILKEENSLVLHLCHPSLTNEPAVGFYVNDKIREFRNEIKNKYFILSPKKEKNDTLSVCVHIRRDDAIYFSHRFIPNEYYVKMIELITNILETNKINFNIKIYTQRLGYSNIGLEKYDTYFDDQTIDTDVWNEIINSDIIVGSNSAFSTSAGMFTDGIYIHPQQYGQLLVSDWLYGCSINSDILQKKVLQKYD